MFPQSDRTMKSGAVALRQKPEVLSAVCSYPHASRTTGPRAPTDCVIPPLRWRAHSASGLHSLSTSVSFSLVLCFCQTTAPSSLRSYHRPGQSRERRVYTVLVCRGRAVSWRSAACLCVSCCFLEAPLSNQAEHRQGNVLPPKPSAGGWSHPSLSSLVWLELELLALTIFRSLLEFFFQWLN